MKRKTLFNLVAATALALALGRSSLMVQPTQAQESGPQTVDATQGEALGTAFTYQGRLTDDAGGPIAGPCDLRFSLYDAATGSGQIGVSQTKSGVAPANGFFTVALNFGADAFNGEARYVKIEVDCGGGYAALTPRVAVGPAPYALALPGLRTQQNTTSPNVIGGHSGNSVTAGMAGATIGGGGMSGYPNRVTGTTGTVSGGVSNTAGDAGTVAGGEANTAAGGGATVGGGAVNSAGGNFAAVGGGLGNLALGESATVPGGSWAHAPLHGQMAYAGGTFDTTAAGGAQASLYVMRNQTTGSAWEDLYLDGSSALLTVDYDRTLCFDILVVGSSDAGESVGYYIWGLVENVGGTTTAWASTSILHEDDATWDAKATGMFGDHLAIQVKGNGETIRWVATVRTAEVAW